MKHHKNHGLRKICACPRRTWPKCAHPWHFNFRWKGTEYRRSLDRVAGRHIDSKTEAETEAERIRGEIKAGTFEAEAPVLERLTLAQLFALYVDRRLAVVRPGRAADDQDQIRVITAAPLPLPTGEARAFGAWLVIDVTADTLERFREVRLARGGGRVAVNRNLSFLRAMFNWAVAVGYLEKTPFKRGTVTVVKLTREASRNRRLQEGEEEALLAACNPQLHALVVAALETGCRLGELLSLQWRQVHGRPFKTLELPAAKTKTRENRTVPISTRLRAVLELRQHDPAGEPLPPEAYVFGNEIGERSLSIKTAWMRAVLRAHGIAPQTVKGTHNLTADSRAAFRAIGLHFHDLRREAGSRWLEAGLPLQVIRDWLGHTSIAQTSTYLATTVRTQFDAMKQFEAHRAALQTLANGAQKGGRKRSRPAKTPERNPKESGGNRDGRVM